MSDPGDGEAYGTYERLRAAGVEMCGDCMTLCRPESPCGCCRARTQREAAGQ